MKVENLQNLLSCRTFFQAETYPQNSLLEKVENDMSSALVFFLR